MVRLLRRAFGLVLGMLVVVGAGGAGALALVSDRVLQVTSELTPAVEANKGALQAMVDAQTGLRGYQITGDPSFLEPYDRGRPQVAVRLDEIESLVGDADVVALVRAERRSAQAWLDAYADPGEALSTERSLVAKSAFDEFRDDNRLVTERLVDERATVRGQVRTLQVAGLVLLGALTLGCAGLGTLAARRTVQAMHLPLRRLGEVLERLRMGESSARADPSGPLEFGLVARAANALADESERLRETQRESARMRRTAHEASRRVREELGREPVLTAAAAALGEALDVDQVWIRCAPPSQSLEPGSALPADFQWARTGLGEQPGLASVTSTGLSLTHRLWRDGEVLTVPNVRRIPASRDAMNGRDLALAIGATALLVAPVGGNDDVLAAVVLFCTGGPREFSPDEVAAVQSVCADLGRALEHSMLFEQQLELVDRLQELDRQKTDFLSTVSHELRTPLTSISGYAELLRDGDAGPVTAPMARMLEVIERNTVRLKALIEDLLTLSRIESAAFRTSVDDVSLAALVSGVEQAVTPAAMRENLELVVGPVDPGLRVRGDELQLERVLLNLVSNALKFTPAPGRVTLEVTTEVADGHGWAVVRCADTGIGIPLDEQEQLFSRFFRASNAVDRAVPGTGLGLTIVRSIVEHHGGRLDLVSAPGSGTTVTVHLPLAGPPPGEHDDGAARFDAVGLSLAD